MTLSSSHFEGESEIRKQGRLWRSPEARSRFEKECGLHPIIHGNSTEAELQHQEGRTKEYHDKFQSWAKNQK